MDKNSVAKKKKKMCEKCKGAGFIGEDTQCPKCKGTGEGKSK